jgi:hypothetical protein
MPIRNPGASALPAGALAILMFATTPLSGQAQYTTAVVPPPLE